MAFRQDLPRSRLHLPLPRHYCTAFIEIELRQCIACGDCVTTCPRHVLGIIAYLGHRHVHVDRGADCKGCRKCIAACSRGVIHSRQEEDRRKKTNPQGRGD